MTVPPIFNDRYPAILHNADIDAADLVAGATYEIGLWAVRVDSDVTFVSEPAVGEIDIPESGELHNEFCMCVLIQDITAINSIKSLLLFITKIIATQHF